MQQESESKDPLSGFILMDETKKLLELALASEQNVVLFGKGGYGKSEFSIEFLKSKGINPFVLTMGTGMTTERMFGGFDLHTFNTTGKMEYLLDNSFMNSEHVIFEELFDAPDYILEQLKDILSSGVFRNGSQVYPIKTKVIICCTNKTRKDFSKNLSLKALMERFPLEYEVKWESHNKSNYKQLFLAKFGQSDPFMEELLETFDTEGATISPRIALTAFEIMQIAGYDSLKYIADFSANSEILAKASRNFAISKQYRELESKVVTLVREVKSDCAILDSSSSLASLKAFKSKMADLTAYQKQIQEMAVPDSLVVELGELQSKISDAVDDSQAIIDLI